MNKQYQNRDTNTSDAVGVRAPRILDVAMSEIVADLREGCSTPRLARACK